MSQITTITRKRDIYGPVADALYHELDAAFGIDEPGPVEVRFIRDGDGAVVSVILITYPRVELVSATESDRAWARVADGAPKRRTTPLARVPVPEPARFPAGSLKARLAARRASEQTG